MTLDPEALVAVGASRSRAEQLAAGVRAAAARDPLEIWRVVSKTVLAPSDDLEVHRAVHRAVFDGWDPARGPAPAWFPRYVEIAATNLGKVMAGDYAAFHRASVADPSGHWEAMLERLGIALDTPPTAILEGEGEQARWLVGARLNIAASALSGPDDRIAVLSKRPGGALERHTLGELRADAWRVAASLDAAGFEPGEAIAVDMPMTYASVAIYLGIVAFGGAVVSIADSFAAAEIATRLRIAEAKGIFTQDVIVRGEKRLPLYERVKKADAPRAIVLSAGEALSVPLRDGDQSWEAFLDLASSSVSPFVAPADHTTNVLFSSGTTGEPKAIPWTQVAPIKAAADAWGHQDVRVGDVLCWPTNLGWMMGPWLIYASLLNGAAMALFEGLPHTRAFGQLVEEAGVTMLGVVPSLVKAWRQSGAMDGLDWSSVRSFSSTGEASAPEEMHWLMTRAGYAPVIEYCGGTEIGGGYITGTMVQPQAPATFSTPALGCDLVLVDEAGQPTDKGEVALVAPIFGSSSRLLNREHHEVYFAGMPTGPRGEVLRRHGDQMERLPGGYYRALGRADDTMNLGGIKTSSAEIERVLERVEGVHETAAIAASPPGGGPSQLVVYVVPTEGAGGDHAALHRSLQQAIREELNPLFKIHEVVVVDALPRTASNKVMRRVLRDRYESR